MDHLNSSSQAPTLWWQAGSSTGPEGSSPSSPRGQAPVSSSYDSIKVPDSVELPDELYNVLCPPPEQGEERFGDLPSDQEAPEQYHVASSSVTSLSPLRNQPTTIPAHNTRDTLYTKIGSFFQHNPNQAYISHEVTRYMKEYMGEKTCSTRDITLKISSLKNKKLGGTLKSKGLTDAERSAFIELLSCDRCDFPSHIKKYTFYPDLSMKVDGLRSSPTMAQE